MTAPGPGEALSLGQPAWGEPQRRTSPGTTAVEVSTDDVARLAARREARAAVPPLDEHEET